MATELWVLAGALLWVGVLVLALAMCVAAGRADRGRRDASPAADDPELYAHAPRFARHDRTRRLARR